MKNFIICLVLALMLTFVTGCQTPAPSNVPQAPDTAAPQQDAPATQEPEPEAKKFMVGMTNNGLSDSFAIKNKAYFEEHLAAAGYEVIATVNDDVSERITAIDNMITQGVDALIIIEGSVFDLETVLREAHDAGIVVISFTAGYDENFVDYYVSGDDALQAQQAMEQMVSYMGDKGSIVEIINDVGEMIRIRKEAMHAYIAEKYPDIHVDYSMVYAWPDYYADVYSKVEALLQAHPEPGEISGIFATFDGVGLAAAAAVRDAGLQDYITIVGICGDDDTWVEMQIEDTPFKATIAQSVPDMCDCAIEGLTALLNGEDLEDRCPIVPAVVVDQSNFKEWAGIQ